MKKIRFALLFAAAIFLLTGCGQKAEEEGREYHIYYLNREETRVEENSYLSLLEDKEELLEEMLAKLAEAPEDVKLKAPLTYDFQILSTETWSEQILVKVDEAYRKLPPTTEVLVRAAIVRTLTQIDGISFVTMQIREEPLLDTMGNAVGPMSADMFVNNAGKEINSYENAQLTLYFAGAGGDKLVKVTQRLAYSTNISMEKLVVEQLIAGPKDTTKGAYPTINPATKIISVTVKDGVCYVNLDSGFAAPVGNVTAETAVYSLTNSLVELSNVNKVQIAINGETDLKYRDKLNLSTVFERNLDIMENGTAGDK